MSRPDPHFPLHDADLATLLAALHAGRLTARALVAHYLARIAAVDRSGPTVNSVLALNPDADADAAQRDAAPVRGPLHGLPILLKGNVDSADSTPTSAGSLALADHRARRDATVTARLRAAGAVILGKTNLSEWANFRSRQSSSGWSSAGGLTRNPHVLDRNPSGSSSGSAAAVAAGLCAAAIGTETDGSIVSPASACGIVGLKPTVGLVSRAGIIPIAHSQDSAGPMTRTVADAARLLGVLAGSDPRDPATAAADGHAHSDYTQFLTTDGLRGARIGVVRAYVGRNTAVDALFAAALARLRDLGAELVDPVALPPERDYREAEFTVLLYEFKHGLNAYLAQRNAADGSASLAGGSVSLAGASVSLADVIAFNARHADHVLPHFGQDILEAAEACGPLTDAAYTDARALCRRLAADDGIDKAMADHQLDALVAPSGGPAWLTDLVNGDHYAIGSSTPAAVAGYPIISVPMGFVRGLPVGLSFFGRAYAEPTLLRLAYAFEQATQARRAPQFRPTLPLPIPPSV